MTGGCESVEMIEVQSWNELLRYEQQFRVFRGHENAEWDLKTTLERACERIDPDLLRADKRESDLLREFRRRFHQYSQHEPEADNSLEWLSIMQHYGAPTRLLDWTYSLAIATYFALYKASRTHSAAVWYLDHDWCAAECARALKRVGKNAHYVSTETRVEDFPTSEFHCVFIDPPYWDGVALLNPFHLDVRLRNQRGVSTAIGNVRKTSMENIRALSDWRSHVKKLVIRPPRFREFFEKLVGMNITHSLLFPGLEGFAVGLGVYHPILWS